MVEPVPILAGLLLGAAVLACASASRPSDRTPRPVDRVELDRYVGTWHEIARIPNRFQDACVGETTATYRLRPDGRIDVRNACVEADGEVRTAEGVARVVDPASNARLEVSFFSIFGWRPVWGDYWVIGLGEDYEWAVVGTPDREYGWILARERALPAGTRVSIDDLLRRQAYDPADFLESPRGGRDPASPTARVPG